MKEEHETFLYIGGFELPDKNASAHRVIGMGKLLRERGKEIVFVGKDRNIEWDADIFSTRSEIDGFVYYSLPYPRTSKEWIHHLTDPTPYLKVLTRIHTISSIVFFDFPAICMARLQRYCRARGIKCYADITEWYAVRGQGKGMLWQCIKGVDTCLRMRFFHKKMDSVVVISRYLEKYYKKRVETFRIPMIEDLQEEKWVNPYEKSTNCLRLVYAGMLQGKDRIDCLMHALAKTRRNCCLDVYGITREEYEKLYPSENVDLDQKIIFHGRVSHEEVLRNLKQANYACFFRDQTRKSNAGFPSKFVEAVCCGTPVITNDTSDIKEYCKDRRNGIITSTMEANEIRKAIEQCSYVMETKKELFDFRNYIDKVNW